MTLPSTMRAIHVASKGGPDAVSIQEVPVPTPRPGQVLVRVNAAGLNFADLLQTRGEYVGGPEAPYIAGGELAGEVVAVGPGTQVHLGVPVMGLTRRAFAEYAVLSERSLFTVPSGWTMTQAAGFPAQWLTAHGCLRTLGRLKAGEFVLIHAVSSGVGLAALALARHFGATAIGTASTPEKLAVAQARGLEHGIVSTQQDLVSEVKRFTHDQGVDLVLEMVGGDSVRQSWEATRPYGRIVVYGAASGQRANISNVRLIFQPVEFLGYHVDRLMTQRPDLFAEEMLEVADLIAQGVMRPEEPQVWPADQIQDLLRAMDTRKTTGKHVITF